MIHRLRKIIMTVADKMQIDPVINEQTKKKTRPED
jgi:hypothetical protein